MPPKLVICEICGEEVSKPKSYAYKDGRACRTHPEAQEAHQHSQGKKRKRLDFATAHARGKIRQHLRDEKLIRKVSLNLHVFRMHVCAGNYKPDEFWKVFDASKFSIEERMAIDMLIDSIEYDLSQEEVTRMLEAFHVQAAEQLAAQETA